MTANDPRFSIITPSYNQLGWLKLAVKSVADQAVAVEHIVSDGGSDGMPDFQEWLAATKELSRTVSFRIGPDGGMYDAINQGLKRSKGEICAWLNCDEQYLPGTLQAVADFFEARPDVDVLFGDAILTDKNGEALSYRRAVLPDRTHIRLSHINTLSCATFFRRRVVETGIFFDVKWRAIGDAEWMDRVLAAGFQPAVLRQPLSVFTWLPENLSNSDRAREEIRSWREAVPAARLRKPVAVLKHRLCKMLAGAYVLRDLEYAIYTLQQVESRRTISAQKIGWSWPETAATNVAKDS